MTTERIRVGGKVIIVSILSVVIWKLTLFLFDTQVFVDNVTLHICAGVFLSALVCALIIAMFRIEKEKLYFPSNKIIPKYLKGFGFGFLCWLGPAAMCIFVLKILGLVSMNPQASPFHLTVKFLTLMAAVFFMEAFPEEIIRGYLYSRLERSFSPWISVSVQTILFTLFAFFVGSLYSTEQWLFIPGFGFLLGYFRMLSGNILFSIGFHAAMMTFIQLITPVRQLVEVDGSFFMIRVLSFVTIPAIFGSIMLHFKKTM